VYVNFHKRPEKIPSRVRMTSRNLGEFLSHEQP
jgi:hypothetical protein